MSSINTENVHMGISQCPWAGSNSTRREEEARSSLELTIGDIHMVLGVGKCTLEVIQDWSPIDLILSIKM
jgi:hypothetical protein